MQPTFGCAGNGAPDNADVWHLRFHWRRDGKELLNKVQQGHYWLSPMQHVHCRNGQTMAPRALHNHNEKRQRLY
ncbi:TPA: hypothetical protein N5L21_003706 [Enterobacter bugandensis]|nr:hypothetical protein [Enterobacter bugandensis]